MKTKPFHREVSQYTNGKGLRGQPRDPHAQVLQLARADGGARAARWRGRIWCFDVSRRLPECKTDAIGLGERPSARSGWTGAVRACQDASSLHARLTMGARVAADAARLAGELLGVEDVGAAAQGAPRRRIIAEWSVLLLLLART